jgi:dCMP deaminase
MKNTTIESELSRHSNEYIEFLEKTNQLPDRPSWNEAFMLAAYQAAERSSCLYLHTGAVVVIDKRVRASGYNGAPPGIKNCLERGCRKDYLGIELTQKGTGNCRGAHAEVNAMRQLSRDELKGASLYTVFFPCSPCAKEITSNGIAEVYYSIMYGEPDSLTLEQFEESKIKIQEFHPNLEAHYLRLRAIDNQRFKKQLTSN